MRILCLHGAGTNSQVRKVLLFHIHINTVREICLTLMLVLDIRATNWYTVLLELDS
jgi:hypothetical protein